MHGEVATHVADSTVSVSVERYLMGDCARLARAVHDLTGRPIVIVEGLDDQDQPLTWVHAGVLCSHGRFHDAAGSWAVNDILESWSEEFDPETEPVVALRLTEVHPDDPYLGTPARLIDTDTRRFTADLISRRSICCDLRSAD